MKVMVIVKATPDSENGITPDEKTKKMFEDMGKYNERLVKAGILEFADGLKPSSAGKRITITDDGGVTVVDGPFAETKELVAGFWVWNVKTLDEAISWAKQCPNPMPGNEGVIEVRPFNTMDDFKDLMSDEAVEREERLRKQVEGKSKVKKAAPKAKAKTGAKAKAKSKAVPAKRKPAKAKSKK